jgi:hypothetical protein
MSEQPPRLDLCCSLPADAPAVHTDLFDLQPVADGVYAAIAAPQYKLNSNAAVILTNDGAIVVDSHSKPSAFRNYLTDLIASVKQAAAEGATVAEMQTTVAEQLAPKYEQGMSKYPLGQYRDRIGPTIEIVYHKVVQMP